jgi:flagellar basal-body rod protein FlgC
MALSSIFDVAGTALTAQSKRLNVVASNLANADSASTSADTAYHAKQVIFQTLNIGNSGVDKGVKVASVVDDPTPMHTVYEPNHPLANAEGYVTYPNVNPVEEMVNMISASRSYQNEVEVMNTTKTLLQKTLTLGQ